MLVMDVGDEMCCRQLRDVGDGFDHIRLKHPKIQRMSPTSKKCHQHLCSQRISSEVESEILLLMTSMMTKNDKFLFRLAFIC